MEIKNVRRIVIWLKNSDKIRDYYDVDETDTVDISDGFIFIPCGNENVGQTMHIFPLSDIREIEIEHANDQNL